MFLLKDEDYDKYEAVSGVIVHGLRLYAITDKKEYYKIFVKNRDMSKFAVATMDVNSEEEYNDLLHFKDVFNYELTKSSFPTTVETGNGYYELGYVDVICTIRESDTVEYDYEEYILNNIENVIDSVYTTMLDISHYNRSGLELLDAMLLYPKIFNEEICEALEVLDFTDFTTNAITYMDYMECMDSSVSLNEDKLKVYCIKYSNTYGDKIR